MVSDELLIRITNCLPSNPYPESIFTMTTETFVEAVPDEDLRTAISGCIGREVWRLAMDVFVNAVEEEFAENG